MLIEIMITITAAVIVVIFIRLFRKPNDDLIMSQDYVSKILVAKKKAGEE